MDARVAPNVNPCLQGGADFGAARATPMNTAEGPMPRVSSSLDVQEVLTAITIEAVSLLRADVGDIILKDDQEGVFRVVAEAGRRPRMVGKEYPLGHGLCGDVLASGRTRIVPDYLAYPQRVQSWANYGVSAVMSSPLVARGESLGVLTVEHTDRGATFSDDDARLLTSFANHAAVALDNARRYENEVALAYDLASANEQLSRSLTLQRRLVEQVLADHGPTAVVSELADLLGHPVLVQDRLLRVIAGASPDRTDEWRELALPQSVLGNRSLAAHTRDLGSSRRPARLTPDIVDGPARLAAPVVTGQEEFSGFLVVGWMDEPTELDLALIEVAATGVALELLKISARAEVEQALMGELAVDLVHGAYSTDETILMRAARMGYDLTVARDMIVMHVDNLDEPSFRLSEREIIRLKRRIFQAISSEVTAASAASVVAVVDDRTLILAAVAPATGGECDSRDFAESLQHKLRVYFPELSFSIALGDRCSQPRDYAEAFDVARRALDAMMNLGKAGVVVGACELGIYRLVLEATDNEALRAYVVAELAPLLEDGRRGRELVDTLQAYVASGFNQRETARRCYVHINTVANRLERIGQRLGRDLSDPEVLVEVALALRLATLMGIL